MCYVLLAMSSIFPQATTQYFTTASTYSLIIIPPRHHNVPVRVDEQV
jgi:hypothetical protein